MKKAILLALCIILVVPLLAYAQCPNYEFGYQGQAQACIFGMVFPVVGAGVTLHDLNNAANDISDVTDAAGNYAVSIKTNNCGRDFGFVTQKWSVVIDTNAFGLPATKTCEAQADFICCCEQCVQSIIQTCSLLYKFCC